jgi:glutathione peroxidase
MKSLVAAALAAVLLCGMIESPTAAGPAPGNAYEHAFEAIEGGSLPLEKFRGKVLLVVNTASFCGFTPQYEGLQALWQRYEAQGLVVVGVPSNDFGAQEPKDESEILGFCKGAFNVTFPLTTKQPVLGKDAHPFYRWARETLGEAQAPKWNFHKYLVGRDGKLIAGFATRIEPLSPELTKAIDAALAKPAS